MIEVNKITKHYARKTNKQNGLSKFFQSSKPEPIRAAENISFTAHDGKITGLLGANGAGKSTTLRVISTLVKPESGSVSVDGVDVVKDALGARAKIGFLPHNAGIYPRLTAIENIRYYAQLSGLDSSQTDQRVDELIDQLDMKAFADRRCAGFSQGQKTKVALARALVHKPQTLILDEPTNGLDVIATRNLRDIIRKLKQQGHCILFSSHVMQEVAALCDHIVIINAGRIVMADSVGGIRERTACDDLEDAFVAAIGSGLEL